MKKKILSLAMIAMLAAVSVSGTLAYYTAKGQAHNVITTGGVDIRLVEKTEVVGDDGTKTLVDFPEEGIGGVMPGTSVSKIVSVKNDGNADAWIRIKVAMEIKKDDKVMELYIKDDKGERTIPVMSYQVDDAHWLYDGQDSDGYHTYYYRESVAPGKSTDTLFEKVMFAKEMDNEYQNCRTNIIVSAQAVQVANNPIPDGGEVSDITGWPKE